MERPDLGVNRRSWDAEADAYQERNRAQIDRQMVTGDITWGVWGIPESRLNLLGDVGGKRVLEVGCGAAQWSIALARRGARPVGLDLSWRQLRQARQSMLQAGVTLPVVHAAGEWVPFAPESFDIVFADYGAFTFGEPHHTIPEAARVLRSGGLLVFCAVHPILSLAWPVGAEHPADRLVESYFELYRTEDDDGSHEYQLPFGAWIALFTENGLVIESLTETRPEPDAVSTYRDETDREWSRRWPAELIWRLRKR